jgi:DNA-binding NarL/FixJ family response regulator
MNANAQSTPPIRHTVLLVDGDPRVRQMLALLLRWDGAWEVLGEAADHDSALTLAAGLRPDLVLLDRWLADGDGLRVVAPLLALARPPQVVILSADPIAALQAQALGLGDVSCLDKLTPPLELLQALHTLVRQWQL